MDVWLSHSDVLFAELAHKQSMINHNIIDHPITKLINKLATV